MTAGDDTAQMDPALPGSPGAGAYLVAAERGRQITVEGWTAKGDDAYEGRELAHAALCYLREALGADHGSTAPPDWPFDPGWWKPADRIKDLAKAGALIAAEIDRLLRATCTLSTVVDAGDTALTTSAGHAAPDPGLRETHPTVEPAPQERYAPDSRSRGSSTRCRSCAGTAWPRAKIACACSAGFPAPTAATTSPDGLRR